MCKSVCVPDLEYFSKNSTLKKILANNFFLIFECAHARAHKNLKKNGFFYARVRACTILRIFFKKNRLSYLEYFSKKSTLKKILPYKFFFDIQMRARARAHKKINFFLIFMRARACAHLNIKKKL